MSCREQPSREAEDFGRRPAEQDWLGRKTLRDDFGELLVGEVVGVESITDRDRPGLSLVTLIDGNPDQMVHDR